MAPYWAETRKGDRRLYAKMPLQITPGNDITIFQKMEPLSDPRWETFVSGHPNSSVFHSTAWLKALKRTYGYRPVAYTSQRSDGSLLSGLPFCQIESWLTGKRLVSLPFADHCDFLTREYDFTETLRSSLLNAIEQDELAYCELRPLKIAEVRCPEELTSQHQTFAHHQLDLTPALSTLFSHCHKDSVQRKIRRASREKLRYESGCSPQLLDAFYRLMVITRRRHGIPPQPKKWFQILSECFGEKLKIRVAWKDGRAVAAILTLQHKDTLVYKYGCSDARFSNLGGTQAILWNAIEEAKTGKLTTFDLGRSDIDNAGLITFKDRWGAIRSPLLYRRFYGQQARHVFKRRTIGTHTAKGLVRWLPGSIIAAVGRVLYPHIG